MTDNHIEKIWTLLNSIHGLHPGPLPNEIVAVLEEHIRLLQNAIHVLSKSMSATEAFDVISAAGSETEEYCAVLEMFDGPFGWVCREGRPAAMLGASACGGWPLDPLTRSIENPWWTYLNLLSDGLCITYGVNEPEEPVCIEIRVSTETTDETFLIYSEE